MTVIYFKGKMTLHSLVSLMRENVDPPFGCDAFEAFHVLGISVSSIFSHDQIYQIMKHILGSFSFTADSHTLPQKESVLLNFAQHPKKRMSVLCVISQINSLPPP